MAKAHMRVRYSRRAVADLIGIADHIREYNPRAAEAVEKRIRASIEQLEMFPFSVRPTDDPSIRMFPIMRYPRLLRGGGEVVIHHIRHGRREPLDPGEVRSE